MTSGSAVPGAMREQMDQIVDQHFVYEATDDIEGVMGTLTDDAEHEVIPSPMGALSERAKMRDYYELLFAGVKGESVTPLRRLYGEDFVVDETLWHGRVEDGGVFLCEGKSGPVSFRLLHVFNLRDGKITREQVWCDLAAIQQQLGCTVS
jgi:ketosteroid isomerase-like protein